MSIASLVSNVEYNVFHGVGTRHISADAFSQLSPTNEDGTSVNDALLVMIVMPSLKEDEIVYIDSIDGFDDNNDTGFSFMFMKPPKICPVTMSDV